MDDIAYESCPRSDLPMLLLSHHRPSIVDGIDVEKDLVGTAYIWPSFSTTRIVEVDSVSWIGRAIQRSQDFYVQMPRWSLVWRLFAIGPAIYARTHGRSGTHLSWVEHGRIKYTGHFVMYEYLIAKTHGCQL